jgi:hypothetical protein
LTDIKPDNILVNWTCDEDGNKTVSDAALGDFDIAYKSEGGKPRETPYAIGNVMWRSRRTDGTRSDQGVRHILVWPGDGCKMLYLP